MMQQIGGCSGPGARYPETRKVARGGTEKWTTYAANRNILLARLLEDLGNNTLLLELKVHLGLVGLDLYQDVAGGDGVTGLLLPGSDVAMLHGGRQSGHLDDLVLGERGIVSHDMRSEAGSQGIVGRGEESPPESDAEHCREGINVSLDGGEGMLASDIRARIWADAGESGAGEKALTSQDGQLRGIEVRDGRPRTRREEWDIGAERDEALA